MEAILKLYGGLDRYLEEYNRETGLRLKFNEGLTVKQVLEERGIPLKIINMVMVDDEVVDLEYRIKDGDKVLVIPPIGGG